MTTTKVGAHTVYFAVNRDGLKRSAPAEFPHHPWPRNAQVAVTVLVFEQDGQLFAGDMSMSTVPQDYTSPWPMKAPTVEPLPIGAELWRMVPTGQITNEALTEVAADYWTARETLDDDSFRRLSQATPEATLQLVARAYQAGGSRGVQAVRRALDEAGYPPAGEHVTVDQAKKKVQQARKAGLIPPARRRQN